MNKTIATTVATAILGIAGIASATPPSVSSYQIRGAGANASAYVDGGDCISASLDISVNDDVYHSRGGAPSREDGGWVGFWSYDWCKGEEAYGYGYISNPNLSIGNGTASASFQINVDIYGWRENPDGSWDYVHLGSKPLSVSASWNGVGEAYNGTESYSSRWGQVTTRTRWRGVTQNAEVTLSATLDGAALGIGYAYGSIGTYHTGGTEIYRF